VVYRPKSEIGLELYDRACGNGVVFDWLTFDEWYGGKPEFLRQLEARQQRFVAEVPKTFTAWIRAPRVTERRFRRKRGPGRKTPRLRSGSRRASSVENLLRYSPELRDQPWVRYRVKDGEKGLTVWEVKHAMITVPDERGLPGMRMHLVVARNPLKPEEIKFFVSNAAPETEVQTLLLVAFSRWRVERCFEDGKQEVGLDQWEGRRWLGLKRHLILTSVSYLFLARVRKQLRKKNPDLTVCQVHVAAALVRSWWLNGALCTALIQAAANEIQHWQQAMLNELVTKVEREKAGLVDPYEDSSGRPIREHIRDFKAHLESKGDTRKHITGTIGRIRRIVAQCKWKTIRDLSANRLTKFLVDLRAQDFSVATQNHYLRAIKQFSRWLIQDRRAGIDLLAHLATQNTETDRRRLRRPLTLEEFARLVEAAENGKMIESIPGPDRAMTYTLSAWTGYRRGEIGSLTTRAFQLDSDPPTVTVAAAYSKRKREDTQVLHPELVEQLRSWLASKPDLEEDDLLFPVSGEVPGGVERKTGTMMRLDLRRRTDADRDVASRRPPDYRLRCTSC